MRTIRRRTRAWPAAVLTILATACLDDHSMGPSLEDANGPSVRLGFSAMIVGAEAGQTVRIRAFYNRTDQTAITLPSSPTSVTVTPGVPQQVAVVVRVADCLADPQQAGGTSSRCAVGIALTLDDVDGTPIDEATVPPTQGLPPGTTQTVPDPIVFAPVSQVNFGTIPVLRVGENRTLTASALDGQGKAIASRPIRWSVDTPGILTIDPTSGAVTGVAAGTARVTATAGVRSASVTVRVIRRVSTVVLAPDPAPNVLAGAGLAFVATPKASDGTDAGNLSDRAITWSVVNPAGPTQTASVSIDGVVSGVYPGDADVTVSVDGVSRTVRVRVNAARVEVQSPSTFVLAGTQMSLQAKVLDVNDVPLPNVPLTWGTSNPVVATVDPTGVVTALAPGFAVITASGGGANGTRPVHVTSLQLDIVPATADIPSGTTLQFSTTNAAGPVTWTTSDGNVATISPAGIVTGWQPGAVSIIASTSTPFGVQRGTAQLTVTISDSLGFVGSHSPSSSRATVMPLTVKPSPRK